MKSNIDQLKSRGYIEDHELEAYVDFSKEELLKLLDSIVATERTIAVRCLLKSKFHANFKATCDASVE